MPELKTSITLSEVDQKMIASLEHAIGEKTMTGVIRYALRELSKKIFGDLLSRESIIPITNHEEQSPGQVGRVESWKGE